MTLYRVGTEKLEAVTKTTFADEKILERKDLQRLLRRDISPLGDDLMVIAEEFGDWEESNRRIDLLCLDKGAGLVVVELKRTEDGGHMELQAIRYAAMVSSMTLDQVIAAHARLCQGDHERAKQAVLSFLELESEDDAELTGEVRIVLVSADFSTELTTAVLWLNRHDLDITCVRLRPYKVGDAVLVDATQIIPLPESTDYEVKIRAQEKEKRKAASGRDDFFRRFWGQVIERSKARTQLLANRTTSKSYWISTGAGRTGFEFTIVLKQNAARVECYIWFPGQADKGTAAFKALQIQREDIERAFGESLEWQELEGREACRICVTLPGGSKVAEGEWPGLQDRLIDALIRLEGALGKRIQELQL